MRFIRGTDNMTYESSPISQVVLCSKTFLEKLSLLLNCISRLNRMNTLISESFPNLKDWTRATRNPWRKIIVNSTTVTWPTNRPWRKKGEASECGSGTIFTISFNSWIFYKSFFFFCVCGYREKSEYGVQCCSEFSILLADPIHRYPLTTVFGYVIRGLSTCDEISRLNINPPNKIIIKVCGDWPGTI